VFAHLDEKKIATRNEILHRFHADDDQLVRGVLHDLTESGLIFSSGAGDGAVYRMATKEDLSHVRASEATDAAAAIDGMRWAVIYREGPIDKSGLVERLPVPDAALGAALARLEHVGRIEGDG
jgi:hypothetical protein